MGNATNTKSWCLVAFYKFETTRHQINKSLRCLNDPQVCNFSHFNAFFWFFIYSLSDAIKFNDAMKLE